ncbi:MAG TPA: sensor domain-containing diguanylate cyclase [Acidimicrobiia bacterium]|nr:sensor domain-containing diguanylate cyclase [Acidimicrobiia bacterium]
MSPSPDRPAAPGERSIAVSQQDVAEARETLYNKSKPIVRTAIVAGILLVGLTTLVAFWVMGAVSPSPAGTTRGLALAGVAALIAAPFMAVVALTANSTGINSNSEQLARDRVMEAAAGRREFETRLVNALEMAETEPDALEAVERALDHVVPDAPAELLLADNSHAHLVRVAHSSAEEPPGCGVDSPQGCVAARRGQTMVFPEADALDACPKLRGRSSDPGAAVCVPVSIMGRSVGVLHVTEKSDGGAPDSATEELQALANQVGNRIGMLRVMAETELQASTDGLTGLFNRRSFENKVRVLRRQTSPFALVMADLDEFKRVNDTYGHDAGDRALRIFAETLRSAVRPDDIVCRYGGEEFTVVLPECAAPKAVEIMEHVRVELAGICARGEVPPFTASFGVILCDPHDELEELVARADAALYRAKTQGRDRVVLHGHQPGDLGPLFSANGHSKPVALVKDE